MFSADLTTEERRSRLGHMASVPTAAFLSGADEFVPPPGSGRPAPEALAETLRAAMVSAGPPGDDMSAGSAADVRSGRGAVSLSLSLSYELCMLSELNTCFRGGWWLVVRFCCGSGQAAKQ